MLGAEHYLSLASAILYLFTSCGLKDVVSVGNNATAVLIRLLNNRFENPEDLDSR
jgi:hypothetical protein